MDTSKEYIKMCEKATEIQGWWYVDFGDFYNDIEDVVEVVLSVVNVHTSKKTLIWLPRQDQLQEMMSILHWGLTKKGKEWSTWKPTDQEFLEADSLEKALLKRVMKEKYNKTWNGKRWIKNE